jgi:hypothetical protein
MPRFKPMLTQQDMGGQMQPQQVLREPPPTAAQDASGRTPAQVAKERAIAEAMIGQGMDYSPVASWTQGAARLANALVGGLQQRRADSEEAEGRAGFKTKLEAYQKSLGDPSLSKADQIAQELGLVDDPWASEGARGFVNAQIARNNPAPTDDQREYAAAKAQGYPGTFMDYMQTLKTPVFQPPQGYAIAPGSTPGAPKVVRAEGLPADPAAAPKPQVQKAEDEDIAAVQGVQSINAQLDGIDGMIAGGKLDLGFFNNLGARAQNFAGASTENSTNYATMMSTLEKMRNDSLRLNSGVQTEGDAVRAWNELVANVNDPKVVRAQIARIKVLNERAAAQRVQLINIRRQRNNMESFDPASVALPGSEPAAPAAGGNGWKIEVVP